MPGIIFYFFAFLLLLSAVMMISARNTVVNVLFLALAFFATSVLWILLRAEFLALALLFINIGALIVMFLFVVMMLDLREAQSAHFPSSRGLTAGSSSEQSQKLYCLSFAFLAVVFLVGIVLFIVGPKYFGTTKFVQHKIDFSSAGALGNVLYTKYILPFEICGVLLLVAIAAAISLVYRGKKKL